MAVVLGSVTYKDFSGVSRTIRGYFDNTATEHLPGVTLFDHLGNTLTVDVGSGVGALRMTLWQPPQVIGYDAHDAAVDANNRPVRLGALAKAARTGITLVSADDISTLMADLDGSLLTRGYGLPDLIDGNASNTDGTTTEVIAAQAAGIKTYVTWAAVTNTHASTFCYVEIKDGTTVRATLPVPPLQVAAASFPTPLVGTAATAWNFDSSAAVTTIICSAGGFVSKT
jgi:hypothetical protein